MASSRSLVLCDVGAIVSVVVVGYCLSFVASCCFLSFHLANSVQTRNFPTFVDSACIVAGNSCLQSAESETQLLCPALRQRVRVDATYLSPLHFRVVILAPLLCDTMPQLASAFKSSPFSSFARANPAFSSVLLRGQGQAAMALHGLRQHSAAIRAKNSRSKV